MRHGIAGNRLGRKTAHRKATVRDIAKATLIEERIETTKAKAKEARKLVDKLITLGKKGTLAHKRRAYAVLCNHKLVSDLFNFTAPRFESRKGGYTRIIPIANRRGDNAEMVLLELTEKAPVKVSAPKKETAKSDVPQKKSKAKAESVKAVESETSDVSTKSKKATKPRKSKAETEEKVEAPLKDKPEAGKKFGSGLKKMFNRKSSGK